MYTSLLFPLLYIISSSTPAHTLTDRLPFAPCSHALLRAAQPLERDAVVLPLPCIFAATGDLENLKDIVALIDINQKYVVA